MTVTKIYCDHCRKKLNTMEDCADTQLDLCLQYVEVDLCKYCIDELINRVKEYCDRI